MSSKSFIYLWKSQQYQLQIVPNLKQAIHVAFQYNLRC